MQMHQNTKKNVIKINKCSPDGCELTLAGDSLAVDGATMCVCPEATEFCWCTLEFWFDVCCCWTPTWLDCCVDCGKIGGLCPSDLYPPIGVCPVVSSYMAAVAVGWVWWEASPQNAPAAVWDTAETSWGSYNAHASGMVEKCWGEIVILVILKFQ